MCVCVCVFMQSIKNKKSYLYLIFLIFEHLLRNSINITIHFYINMKVHTQGITTQTYRMGKCMCKLKAKLPLMSHLQLGFWVLLNIL